MTTSTSSSTITTNPITYSGKLMKTIKTNKFAKSGNIEIKKINYLKM